jgi:phosphoribosylaminoimidazole (AIR) synthetase
MKARPQTYAQVGVDIDVEAQAARILYHAAKQTWSNRADSLGEVIVPFDDFAGLRYIDVSGLPQDTVMYGCSDGVATKAEFAERSGREIDVAVDH